ncbi:MAG TPA: IS110 family transposase [Candidatus Obscuribacterales bacterium]
MKRHQKTRKTKPKPTASKPLHEPLPDAAGIDLGATEIWVAVGPDRCQMPVRRFGTFTQDLLTIVEWLLECGIRTVAMEATGIYWVPLHQHLSEAGIEVCLVNARHVKNVPGRKSDVRDCQWLQYLHSVGLLRASFRPAQAICNARTIYRFRQDLLGQSTQHLQHMQAALDQMNIKLHYVIDDLSGQTGQRIIEAILNGERDPLRLAKLRNRRVKASEETIAKSLEGDWRDEQLFVLRTAWENGKQIKEQILKCDQKLLEYTQQLEATTVVAQPMGSLQSRSLTATGPAVAPILTPLKTQPKTSKNEPAGPWRQELTRLFGVDLSLIPGISILTSITLLSELGNDLSAFRSAQHFSSWLCLCPDNETSSGRVLHRRTRRSQSRVRLALRMAASSLHHEKSFLGEKYRRLRTKLGAPKAITAMAHQLARIIWHLITHKVSFEMSIFAALEKAHQRRRLNRLHAAARQMGFQLTQIAA